MRKCTWWQVSGIGYAGEGDTNAYIYTTCLYFTITTLSTVGYSAEIKLFGEPLDARRSRRRRGVVASTLRRPARRPCRRGNTAE